MTCLVTAISSGKSDTSIVATYSWLFFTTNEDDEDDGGNDSDVDSRDDDDVGNDDDDNTKLDPVFNKDNDGISFSTSVNDGNRAWSSDGDVKQPILAVAGNLIFSFNDDDTTIL